MNATAVLIITCPCALALAIPIAQTIAISNFLKRGIIMKNGESLEKINNLEYIIFDKTGTITKSGIEYKGVVPMSSLRLVEGTQAVPVEIGICLALAHSVTRVNGALVGHQVELQMVEATSQCGWKFGNDMRAPIDPAGSVWEVINMFPFSHVSMTMSALVVDRASGRRLVVCKGSFEALRQKCSNINDETVRAGALFAQDGYYVLGLATRVIENDLADITRESIDKNLDFQGFILFKN
jgi:magnesium-transporting ATPase (P-type)